MATDFIGTGNLGTDPEMIIFSRSDNDPPDALLKLNVRFDNPIRMKDGSYEDKGGFWAPVEIFRSLEECELWMRLYQRGMRVVVHGRLTMNEWENDQGQTSRAFKVRARSVGILPFRIGSIVMDSDKPSRQSQEASFENKNEEGGTSSTTEESELDEELGLGL